MDDFDYMNGTLSEWLEIFYQENQPAYLINLIEAEYLPRFERAIWMRSKTPKPIDRNSLVVE